MKNYIENREEILKRLKLIYNFMEVPNKITKADIIIGCGCADLDIPKKASELYKKGYAPLILFVGGLGKVTSSSFSKPEALVFKDIALKEGVPSDKILTEEKSNNTGDNFRYSKDLLDKLKVKKIIIIHHQGVAKRTLATAKNILKDKEIMITSPDSNFHQFIKNLESDYDNIFETISVMVGDIQRLLIYYELGWQVKVFVPKEIKEAYFYLKKLGFDKYIVTKEEFYNIIKKNNLGKTRNFHYFG